MSFQSVMKTIQIFLILFFSFSLHAQTYKDEEPLQEMSLEDINERLEREKKKRQDSQKVKKKPVEKKVEEAKEEKELNLYDILQMQEGAEIQETSESETETQTEEESWTEEAENGIANMFDGLGVESSWGDPVANPRIRAGRASNLFGPVRYNEDGSVRWHRGFDYEAPKGTPVLCVGQGTVHSTGRHYDFGLYVIIKHKRGSKTYYSFYAHLSETSVKRGKKVQRGTVLGKSGTTGNAYNLAPSEAHLHFECRLDPKHTVKTQLNPNTIVKTKFYSEDPDNRSQYNVGVKVRKSTPGTLQL